MLRMQLELPRSNYLLQAELNIPSGAVYALFGPSGAGKSSILSVIAGLETGYRSAFLAWNDNVLIDTEARPKVHVPVWQRQIGYMTQSAHLFPHLDVRANIRYGQSQSVSNAAFDELVQALDLNGSLHLRPAQLSGGLAQRVALARALMAKPDVLLMDEPFSALDAAARRQMHDLLANVHQAFGLTIVLVTHQLSEAQRLASEIALIDKGTILQTGSPEAIITTPASWQAASLVGYTSQLLTDAGALAVHPDRVVVGAHRDLGLVITGRVEQVVWLEGRQQVSLLVEADGPVLQTDSLVCNVPPGTNVAINQPLELTLVHPPKLV